MEACLVDDLREQRHEDAVPPGRGRADDDERVHRQAAVAERPPGCDVEPPAGPDLDDRRRHEDEAVDGLHRDHGLGPEHQDHDPDGHGQRDDRLAQEPVRVACPLGGVGVRGFAQRARRRGLARRALGLQVVAGRGDRSDELGPPGGLGQVADRRDLGREIDRRVGHSRGLAQEPLDPVDAACAGHALDREGDRGEGRGSGFVHTPWEYTSRRLAPGRARRHTSSVPAKPAVHVAAVDAPWGPVHLAAGDRGLVACESMTPYEPFVERLERRFHADVSATRHPVLDEAVRQLEEFLADRRRAFDLPIDLSDRPAFDQAVLRAVGEVPWGRVAS